MQTGASGQCGCTMAENVRVHAFLFVQIADWGRTTAPTKWWVVKKEKRKRITDDAFQWRLGCSIKADKGTLNSMTHIMSKKNGRFYPCFSDKLSVCRIMEGRMNWERFVSPFMCGYFSKFFEKMEGSSIALGDMCTSMLLNMLRFISLLHVIVCIPIVRQRFMTRRLY